MPTFGQHETGQRLHLSGVGAIYVLRSDPEKIVKVVQPPEGIWTDTQTFEEVSAFLSHARAQRKVVQNSENWAPIHETQALRQRVEGDDHANGAGGGGGGDAASQAEGVDYKASGAYLVMNRYERTVRSLIDGRVHLNNDDLRTLMVGILKGLRDIRAVLKRPDGNLKPENILLANSANLGQAKVHLSDPAADVSLTAKSDKEDYADLAKILYELVNLRPYQGGTIPRTREWNALGPNGEDWRKLCNTLLDVGSGGGNADDRDLEKIIAAADSWRAKPRKGKLPVIAAAVLLVLIAGGVAAYIMTRPPKLDFDQANWEKLCLEYQSWFDSFANMDDTTKKKFSSDPYPTEVVKLLNKAGRDLDRYQPQNIARKPQSYVDLAITPTDDAKTGYGPYYTKQGDALIDDVAAALTPAHWQLLNSLDKTATTYEKRGWVKPAAGIRSIIAAAKPPALAKTPADIEARAKEVHPVNVFASIDNTIKASRSVGEIEQRWARIQEKIKSLPATDVPLLAALPKFAEDFPRSQGGAEGGGTLADVEALSTSFNQIDQVVTELSTDLNRKDQPIVFSELAKDPAAQLPADGKLTVALYSALPAVAKGYVKLSQDPRGAVAWSHSLDDVQKSFIDPIKEANPADANLKSLETRKSAIEAEVTTFTAIAPIEKNRAQLDTMVSAAKADLATLENDGGTWVSPYIIDPEKYLAQQRSRLTDGPLASATPAVYAEWQKHDKALLDKISAAPQELKKFRFFRATDAKFSALQNVYADFEHKMIPPTVGGLSDYPPAPAWKAVIARRVATVYREHALTDLMTNASLKWADDLPQVADPAYQSYAKGRIAAFEQQRQEALALLDDYGTIEARLDRLDLLPDQPEKGAKGWRELAARWKDSKSPLLAGSEITGAIKPINDRVHALLELDTLDDYKSLAGDALSAAPEISLTAWRKLGRVPISESIPVLEDEDKNETHLGTLVAALAKAGTVNSAKVSSLDDEMKGQRPVRWRRYAATLSSAAPLQNALDRRAAFAVSLSAESDPSLVYDDALYQLRKQFEKRPKESELKDIAKKFIAQVGAMPPAVSKDKAIEGVLARMAKPLAPGAGEVSTAGAGPKLAGWEQETPANNPDVRLFYFPSKAAAKQVLEFTRIQAGDKTVFLCTAEVTFGLFAQVANEHVPDLNNASKPEAQAHWFKFGNDPWDGPRVWKTAGNKFAVNDDWVFVSPQMGKTSPYPANAAPEKPGPAYPMQAITPWSAMYVARALGCRLPTSDEWKAAYDKFESNPQGQKDAWNLRGAGWLVQQQYSSKLAAQGAQYPDQGIFLSADQLFAGINADAAIPWKSAELAKIAPNRIGQASVYPTSQIWFRKAGAQPGLQPAGAGTGVPHDLVGNVAEYVFDGPGANAVIKDAAPSVTGVNSAITAGAKALFVVGGSSLSPPQIPINQPQAVDPDFAQTSTGFSDVGFRLAYTAPIDSIADVLAAVFRAPPYLPGKGK